MFSKLLIWHTYMYTYLQLYSNTYVLVYSNRNVLFIECTKLSQTECTRQEYRNVQDAHPKGFHLRYLQIVNLNKINNTINQ